MAYKNIDPVPIENMLTQLESIFKAIIGKIPGKKTGGLLSIPVQFNGEKYPSPEAMAADNEVFRAWVRERLMYAKAERYEISRMVNLIRKYDGFYGWFAFNKQHEKPSEPELSIYDD